MHSPLIARLALLATALVLTILASSAYLRLSASHGDCPQPSACVTEDSAQEAPSLARKVVRATHRLSASVVAVVMILTLLVVSFASQPDCVAQDPSATLRAARPSC